MTGAGQRGSALVMAVFVLALVTGLGVALLYLSQGEIRMSQASLREKQAFYMAEAGLEVARDNLWQANKADDFGEELLAAAGLDGQIDLDAASLAPLYDADGDLAGLDGLGDDVPLLPVTTRPDGSWYAAFLTNDHVEGTTNLVDANGRVVLTGIGGRNERSAEVVQAVIEVQDLFPSMPPATITMLGPSPSFVGGTSAAKKYIGDDCGGSGVPGLFVPTVGAVGSGGESSAETGVIKPGSFTSDAYSGDDTVDDINDPGVMASKYGQPTIDPDWLDCDALRDMVEGTRAVADVICMPPAACTVPPASPERVVMIDGDWTISSTGSGAGFLLVTGTLTMHGAADWSGLILVVGEGGFVRSGAGNGMISGGMIVADIAGPDNVYGTADDCTGGVDGFDVASFDESGGGTGDTQYCTADIAAATPVPPYKVLEFLQR